MRHALSVVAAAILGLTTAVFALGQETKTTVTTTVTKTVQNPDGTFTVIEYPVKKEIKIQLNPVTIKSGKGIATILRDDDGTRIKLNLTEIPSDVTALNLYAIDDTGTVTPLGPIAITNGVGTLSAAAPLTKFMLIASPAADLTTYTPETAVIFRSTVPEGFAVIPLTSAAGEKVAAVTAPVTAAPVTAAPVTAAPVTAATAAPVTAPATEVQVEAIPMLNIPTYKTGDDTKIKVDFSGALTGARANVFITPRKDGPTEVKMRFHELKDAPAGQTFILWAVSPDQQFTKLGQVVNTPGRNEAEIKSETTLADFGLLVTMENATAIGAAPVGPRIGLIHIVP
jgi:hypothetical protein